MSDTIVVLTGRRGIGKSTVCRKTVALAQAEGHTCRGIVTLSHPDDARDLLDLDSGDTRRLTLQPDTSPAVIQGRFRFDPQTLAWANVVLTRATPCHLLVVDELGPLELEQEKGLLRAFDVLSRRDFAMALVVIRPELVIKTQLRMPMSATTVLTVTAEGRDNLPAVLLEMLEMELGELLET